MKNNIYKLGQICDFEGGSQPPKRDFIFEQKKNYVRFIQIRDFKSNKNLTYIPISNKNRLCNEDDILIGRYGASVGKILTGLSGAYNVALMKISPKTNLIEKKFLYYYLISSSFQESLKKISARSAQNGFNKKDIYDFSLNLPSKEKQKDIVDKLDFFFLKNNEAINLGKKNKNILVSLQSSIYQKNLNKDYREIKLIDVCTKITDGSHFSPKVVSSGYPYITVRDIHDDLINFNNCKFIDKKNFEILKNNGCAPLKDDLLFSKDGTVGKVSLVKEEKDFVVLSSLAILRPDKSVILPEYLNIILKSPEFLNEAIEKKTGAAIRRIILKNLKNIRIKLPELEEQKKLISNFELLKKQLDDFSNNLKRKINNHINLNKSVLKLYFE